MFDRYTQDQKRDRTNHESYYSGRFPKKRVEGRGKSFAFIASAFPGLFRYRDLLNIDVRDLMFWQREAKVKNISDYIKQIQAVRIGMANQEGYSRIIGELEMQLQSLKVGREEVVKKNWDDLKLMKKL